MVSFFTFRRDSKFYYVCKILLSCIPVAIVGLFFKDYIASLFEGNLKVVGVCLLVTAMLLSFAYFRSTVEVAKKAAGKGGGPFFPAPAAQDRQSRQVFCWATRKRRLQDFRFSW